VWDTRRAITGWDIHRAITEWDTCRAITEWDTPRAITELDTRRAMTEWEIHRLSAVPLIVSIVVSTILYRCANTRHPYQSPLIKGAFLTRVNIINETK
jgi:hypothetical protein